MDIKKIDSKSIQLKPASPSKPTVIVNSDEKGFITVKISTGDGADSIEFPGEYGFKSLHFILLEESSDSFVGKPNLLSITDVNNTNILLLTNNFDLSKQSMEKIPGVDVLIAPLTNEAKLKSLIKKIQPLYVVFVKDYLDYKSEEKVVSELQSEMSIVDSETKTVKFDAKDFVQEEEVATIGYILS
jgi:hypothetical protein